MIVWPWGMHEKLGEGSHRATWGNLGDDECIHYFACYLYTQNIYICYSWSLSSLLCTNYISKKCCTKHFQLLWDAYIKLYQFPTKASWCRAHVPFKFITENDELRIKLCGRKSKDIIKNDNFILLKGPTNTKQHSNGS